MKNRATKIPSGRPSLPRVSEEVRVISEFLLRELLSWPKVSTKPMFGLTALYRGPAIFAVLPATRAMETACSVSFKLPVKSPAILKLLESDERIVYVGAKLNLWVSFEIHSDRDVPDALEWFARAYEQAGKAAAPTPKSSTRRH